MITIYLPPSRSIFDPGVKIEVDGRPLDLETAGLEYQILDITFGPPLDGYGPGLYNEGKVTIIMHPFHPRYTMQLVGVIHFVHAEPDYQI